MTYSLFFLVLTTHLALLINAIYQTAYTISRTMNGVNPLPIALTFALSAGGIATFAVMVQDPLQHMLPIVTQVLPAVGAILLFWYAYQAYKLAISPCVCETIIVDTKTIGAILVMNLTSPHALADIALVSGFYHSFHQKYGTFDTGVILVVAFAMSAFIWYGGIGTVAYKLGTKLQFARLHKILHWVSVGMLLVIAVTILFEAYTDVHIFDDRDH